MSRIQINQLLLQWDHIWDKEEWTVPVATALEGLTAKEAAWVPPGGANTIWQTLNHMNYYNERLLCRLTGTSFDKPARSTNEGTFGHPGDPEDSEGWQAAVGQAKSIAQDLRTTLAALTDKDLERPYVSSTLGHELPIWIMHDAYHAGQIVLVRKLLGTWRT
ncbi:DinB family protein [Paenibacillus sedimenti]|uniref:DinB family protein n=1 Tax=Paenibacillus sedimenti TaxID=2770274 RepID=A0A926KUK5_9BACL|nr:DinB family protein [Paenibacillus sedimenti]MBD0382424.1 DinB family protein [Paenibacillus sedimenti]